MDLAITKKAFKSQAQKQLAALKARNVDIKLSDIQESLAIAYGYENLATLYAKFNEEAFSVVANAAELREQSGNLFVISRGSMDFFNEDGSYANSEEATCIYSSQVSLQNIIDAANMHTLEELGKQRVVLPEDWKFAKETVGLSTFAIMANASKYGYPDSVNEAYVIDWVKTFGVRTPKEGVDIDYYDTGDDGCGDEFLLIWVPDEEAACIRKLFDSDPLSGDLL